MFCYLLWLAALTVIPAVNGSDWTSLHGYWTTPTWRVTWPLMAWNLHMHQVCLPDGSILIVTQWRSSWRHNTGPVCCDGSMYGPGGWRLYVVKRRRARMLVSFGDWTNVVAAKGTLRCCLVGVLVGVRHILWRLAPVEIRVQCICHSSRLSTLDAAASSSQHLEWKIGNHSFF